MSEKKFLLVPMNLSFFEAEKSEKPTAKKKEDARKEGQVAMSPEIATAFMLIVVFSALRAFSGMMYKGLLTIFSYSFEMIGDYDEVFLPKKISGIVAHMFGQILLIVLPILAVALAIGLIVNFIQVGWKPTTKPLRPKFSKLSPIKGLKKLFSLQALVTLVKSILKLVIISAVIYFGIIGEASTITKFYDMELAQSVAFIADLTARLGLTVGEAYLVIAALDYAYARFKHNKDLKMSKHEVKEEYKQSEGDPQIKGKIKQRMREASMRRMMRDVPSADVIITNPTHFAVAIKYDMEAAINGNSTENAPDKAPIVVAKGADFLAQRIKQKAREANIAIVENKPLARTLYDTVDIGKEIPPELYAAVAEILTYVYRLRHY